jgi:hypothetical protein
MSEEILRPPVNVKIQMPADMYDELHELTQGNLSVCLRILADGMRLYREQMTEAQKLPKPGLAPVVPLDQFNSAR